MRSLTARDRARRRIRAPRRGPTDRRQARRRASGSSSTCRRRSGPRKPQISPGMDLERDRRRRRRSRRSAASAPSARTVVAARSRREPRDERVLERRRDLAQPRVCRSAPRRAALASPGSLRRPKATSACSVSPKISTLRTSGSPRSARRASPRCAQTISTTSPCRLPFSSCGRSAAHDRRRGMMNATRFARSASSMYGVLTKIVVPAAIDAVENAPELAARDRIDAGRRLVEQDRRRAVNQRACQRELLLHAAGELFGQAARRTASGRKSSSSVRARAVELGRAARRRCRRRSAGSPSPRGRDRD